MKSVWRKKLSKFFKELNRGRLGPWCRGFHRLLTFLMIGHIVYAFVLVWLPVYVTPLMLIRWIQYAGTEIKIQQEWTELDKFSPDLKYAVIRSEDGLFAQHAGFDVDAIMDAIAHNKTAKVPRGASTISQQVAKNVFLWPGRSWIRKGLEVYFTILIETLWSKQRILEVYLNVAETGPGMFGMTVASKKYFHVPPDQLTRNQSILLALILPNPLSYNVLDPSPYMLERREWISDEMTKHKLHPMFLP